MSNASQAGTTRTWNRPSSWTYLQASLHVLILCFLAVSAYPILAQSESPKPTATVIEPKPAPAIDSSPFPEFQRPKLFTASLAQVPDELKRTYSLGELLLEENKRLKEQIERLEKENAKLRAALTGENK